MGTSVESQEVTYRIRHLKLLPAKLRFLSCEPLLGPIDLDLEEIHWVIVGGESGPVRRAMEAAWAESGRDQGLHQGVPCFFKQWGGRAQKEGVGEPAGRL